MVGKFSVMQITYFYVPARQFELWPSASYRTICRFSSRPTSSIDSTTEGRRNQYARRITGAPTLSDGSAIRPAPQTPPRSGDCSLLLSVYDSHLLACLKEVSNESPGRMRCDLSVDLHSSEHPPNLCFMTVRVPCEATRLLCQ